MGVQQRERGGKSNDGNSVCTDLHHNFNISSAHLGPHPKKAADTKYKTVLVEKHQKRVEVSSVGTRQWKRGIKQFLN